MAANAPAIHAVLQEFSDAINTAEAPPWDEVNEGHTICAVTHGDDFIAGVQFGSKSPTGANGQLGYTLYMRGNNVWIPWPPNKKGASPYAVIYTSKQDLTDEELQMGLQLVASTHAGWLRTTPEAPRKMYTIIYGTDGEGNTVSRIPCVPRQCGTCSAHLSTRRARWRSSAPQTFARLGLPLVHFIGRPC